MLGILLIITDVLFTLSTFSIIAFYYVDQRASFSLPIFLHW